MKLRLILAGLVAVLGVLYLLDDNAILPEDDAGSSLPAVSALGGEETLDHPQTELGPRTATATPVELSQETTDPPVAPNHRAPLTLRILDARTDEPIPHFDLDLLIGDEASRALTTRETGEVHLEDVARPAHCEVEWIDDRQVDGWIGWDEFELLGPDDPQGVQEEITLKAPVGPTYYLLFSGTQGRPLDEFTAMLNGNLSAGGPFSGSFGATRIREGSTPWVRFQPDNIIGTEDSWWVLEVLSTDGLLFGSARVGSTIGRQAEPVPIEMNPAGALSGTILVNGLPSHRIGWVRIQHITTGSEATQSVDSQGRFFFSGLEGGEWQISTRVDGTSESKLTATIRPGERSFVECDHSLVSTVGSISARIVSATGTFRDRVTLILRGSDPLVYRKVLGQADEWREEQGRLVFPFEFQDLPDGDLSLHIDANQESYPISPTTKMALRAPLEDLVITVEDGGPTHTLAFEVIDTVTGIAPPHVDALWRPQGQPFQISIHTEPAQILIENLPQGMPLTWVMGMQGRRLVQGNESDFQPDATGRRIARVRLEPGWGAQFIIRDEVTQEPVPDLILSFDGEPSAPSNSLGKIPTSLPEAPRVIDILTPGWRITASDYDPANSKTSLENWWALRVTVARTD